MDQKAQQTLDKIRQGRECNIKTLNTIDTITLDTIKLKTKNQHTFAQEGVALCEDEMLAVRTSSLSSGQIREENDSSQVELPPPEITYISASLKATKTTRQTLNMDFRLSSTPAGDFNKLVFSLTDRYREFLANIPKEYHGEWEYEQAMEYLAGSIADKRWIGKGRPRTKFKKGGFANAAIELGLACVLEKNGQRFTANVWIEGIHRTFDLQPVDNERYPYRYDSGSGLEKVKILPRRSGWK